MGEQANTTTRHCESCKASLVYDSTCESQLGTLVVMYHCSRPECRRDHAVIITQPGLPGVQARENEAEEQRALAEAFRG